jgi:hypothetical protein
MSVLASFALSMTNGSHRPAESQGKQERTKNREKRECGSAISAASVLKQAVMKLCSVKKIAKGWEGDGYAGCNFRKEFENGR